MADAESHVQIRYYIHPIRDHEIEFTETLGSDRSLNLIALGERMGTGPLEINRRQGLPYHLRRNILSLRDLKILMAGEAFLRVSKINAFRNAKPEPFESAERQLIKLYLKDAMLKVLKMLSSVFFRDDSRTTFPPSDSNRILTRSESSTTSTQNCLSELDLSATSPNSTLVNMAVKRSP